MKKITLILISISALVVLAGVVFSTYVAFKYDQPSFNISADDDAIAYRGYDIVSYFNSGIAVEGTTQYQYTQDGLTWRFSSLQNQMLFNQDPERFKAQYGGYDAYGMALEGLTRPSDPMIWTLREGKLYFFSNLDTMDLWNKAFKSNQERADANWLTIQKKLQYLNEVK